MKVARAGGGEGELVFGGCRVWVEDDGKALEVDGGDGCTST